MSARISVGRGCSLAAVLAAVGASVAYSAGTAGTPSVEVQGVEFTHGRVIEPAGRRNLRIVAPTDSQEIGTIEYVPNETLEPVNQWGGSH